MGGGEGEVEVEEGREGGRLMIGWFGVDVGGGGGGGVVWG